MLPGYNHNVCYKGQVFHVQTEDSGVGHPHIITLLFMKGNIIARKKREYGDFLKSDKLEERVREMMQEQHKEMLRELKAGKYDHYLGLVPTPEEAAICAAAAEKAQAQTQRSGPTAPLRPAVPSSPAPVKAEPSPPPASSSPASAITTPKAPAPAKSVSHPASPPPAAREETFQEKPATRTITISEDEDLRDDEIFGDLISDRSLDEVILSFLAKQLEEEGE